MSNITYRKIKKSEIVPVVSLTLELSQRDAEALYRVTQMIEGCPKYSARGLFDSIADCLERAGVQDNPDCVADWHGLHFKYYSEYKS